MYVNFCVNYIFCSYFQLLCDSVSLEDLDFKMHLNNFFPKDLPDYDMDEEDFKFFNEELRERRKFEVKRCLACSSVESE